MNRRSFLLVLSLALPTFVAAQEAKSTQETKSPLTGKWFMTTAANEGGERNFKAPIIRNDLVFDGEKVTVTYDRSGSGGGEKTVTGTYTYDAKSKPARIVFKGLPAEVPMTVIAKVEEDKLTICYHNKGGEVPGDFKTARDDGREIVEFMKRRQ